MGFKTILGCLLVSASHVHGLTFKSSSKSSCRSVAKSKSTSSSQNAFVELGISIGTKICNTVGVTTQEIEVWAEQVAQAVAQTSVYVDASCTGTSGSVGGASADGAAIATAEAHAKALLSGFVSVATCGSCQAEVKVFAETSNYAIVESVTNSWVQVTKSPISGSKRQTKFEENIEVAILPTMVSLATTVQAGFSGEGEVCSARTTGGVRAGSNVVQCDSIVESWTKTKSVSSVATAAVEAGAYSCEVNPSEAFAFAVAASTASAFAAAISESESACHSAGTESFGCMHSKTSIDTVVKAQAQAYAEAMATAGNKCGCRHSTKAISGQIAEIILSVASDAYTEACVQGQATFAQANAFTESVQEATIHSIATALATAVAGWDACGADAVTEACVGCVKANEKCAGSRMQGVLGCCDPSYHCIERDSSQARCKPKSWKALPSWTGKIRSCNENKKSFGPPLL